MTVMLTQSKIATIKLCGYVLGIKYNEDKDDDDIDDYDDDYDDDDDDDDDDGDDDNDKDDDNVQNEEKKIEILL